MSFRIGWLLPLLLILLQLPVCPVGATDDNRVFENLRNQPSPSEADNVSDTTHDSTTSETQFETSPLRLDPIIQVTPPLRSDTIVEIFHDSTLGTPPDRGPPLRLISPGEDSSDDTGTPERSADTPTKSSTRSLPGPPPIQHRRENVVGNATGPYTNRFFVGLRWPGVSVGIHEPPYTLEFKHLEDSPSDISITGLRLYHHVIPLRRANYYWGLDLSRVDFEGAVSEGKGTSTGLFFGFYREVAPHLSWSLDMGPYYIYLRDDATRLSASGLEYTVTTGLNVELW